MKLYNLFFVTLLALLFLYFYTMGDVVSVEYCTFAMLLFNMIFSLQDIKRRFIFLAFQVTFLVFLLGQNFAFLFATNERSFLKSIEEEFSIQTQLYIYLALFVSLLGVFFGYSLNEQKRKYIKTICIDVNSIYIVKLRTYTKKFMYFFSFFAFAVVLEKAIFVQATGYVDYYTSFNSFLPEFFFRFESLYEASIFLFLATFPRWKECRIPLLIYFLIGLTSLGYGQRNGFVLNMLFIGVYFSLRHLYQVYGNSEVWINKKRLLSVAIAIPFLLVFLYSFGSTRNGDTADEYKNPIDNILAFFAQQGGSVRLIGYEKNFSDWGLFPSDAPPYTFGYLIDLYQQNALFKAFDVYPTYEPQSADLAMKGHNFGYTITYLYNQDYYYAGMGLGSCYIAEVHHDFGLIGVFLINFLYGLIFAFIYKYAMRNIWVLFICFMTIMSILYAPRSGAITFINQLLAPSFITYVAIIILLMRKYREKRSLHKTF